MSTNLGKSKGILVGIVAGGLTALMVSLAFWGVFVSRFSSGKIGKDFIKDVLAPYIQTENDSNEDQSYNSDKLITEEDLVINAVKKAEPAVVSVIITKDVPVIEQYFSNPFGENSPFQFNIPQYRQNGTKKQEVGGGSGFIVSDDGYVVTNKHVVEDQAAEYTVFTNDGEKYEAKVIARDPLNDIAVIKIDIKDSPFLSFGDSDKLELGQTAIAIGNPLLQFNNSVSLGIISGLSRTITAGDRMFGQTEQLEGVIQTDAAINPGNSGGPLLNLNGEVIGVNVAMASAENIGFALPANMVQKVFKSVKDTGKIVRPYLGVRYVPITEELKKANNLSVDYGVLILRGQKQEELAVIPGSPADKAGLTENDIILEVDGEKLDDKVSFSRIIGEKSVGDKVKLKVFSKGKNKEVTVTLETAPEAKES